MGDGPTSEAELRATTAKLLAEMGAYLGDGRFSAAAALIKGDKAGRRPVDDAAALSYAEALIRAGLVKSAYRAAEMAAVFYAPSHQVESMRDRLRKKLRTKPIKSEDDPQNIA